MTHSWSLDHQGQKLCFFKVKFERPACIFQIKPTMEQLRILCVGDSLTEGFTHSDWNIIFHPYGESMAATLRQGIPSIKFIVDIEGLSGDRVCPPGLFMPRVQAKCESELLFLSSSLLFRLLSARYIVSCTSSNSKIPSSPWHNMRAITSNIYH